METFKVEVPNRLVDIILRTPKGFHRIYIGNDGLAEARFDPELDMFLVRMTGSMTGDFWVSEMTILFRNSMFLGDISELFKTIRNTPRRTSLVPEIPRRERYNDEIDISETSQENVRDFPEW